MVIILAQVKMIMGYVKCVHHDVNVNSNAKNVKNWIYHTHEVKLETWNEKNCNKSVI